MSEKKKPKLKKQTLSEFLEQCSDNIAQVFKEYGFDAPVNEKTLFDAYVIAGDKMIDRLYQLEKGAKADIGSLEAAHTRKQEIVDLIISYDVETELQEASFTGDPETKETTASPEPTAESQTKSGIYISRPLLIVIIIAIVLLVIYLANRNKISE